MLMAFNGIIRDIKDQVIIQEIVHALELGNVDAVIELLGLDEATWQPLGEAIRSSYLEGGIVGASQIGPIPSQFGTLVFKFNVRNKRAEDWINQQSSHLITDVTSEQIEVVKSHLQAGMARGDNPKTTALELVGRVDPRSGKREGGLIGLTRNHQKWIANARDELENLNPNYFSRKLRDRRLDSVVRKAIESGEPLNQRTIDSAITRMQQRALKYRGGVIARTESITALRAGQFESIAQAVERGRIDPRDIVKKWDSTGDGRTRVTHAQAEQDHKEGIPLNQPFRVFKENGGFDLMMYPGAPGASAENVIQCRCRMIVSIDFGKRIARIEGFS